MSEALTHAFLRSHPEDAARVLEGCPPADVVALMQQLPARIMAPVLKERLHRLCEMVSIWCAVP